MDFHAQITLNKRFSAERRFLIFRSISTFGIFFSFFKEKIIFRCPVAIMLVFASLCRVRFQITDKVGLSLFDVACGLRGVLTRE